MSHVLVAVVFALAIAIVAAAVAGVAAGLLAHMDGASVISSITRAAITFAGVLTLLLAILGLVVSLLR